MLDPREVSMRVALLGLAMVVLVSSIFVSAGVIGVTVLLLFHPGMKIARIAGSAPAAIAGNHSASRAADGVARIALAFDPIAVAMKLLA